MIYAYEPLAYYFNLKPDEFWNGELSEVVKYCQFQVIKKMDDSRENIQVLEVATNKMAQCFSTKPKRISLIKEFSNLFPKKKEKKQTTEEQIAILMTMETSDKLNK